MRRVVRRVGVHRLQSVLALVALPLLAVARATVGRLPRDPRLVVLGAPLDRFADNAAYLFLHLSQRRDGPLVPVWVTGSRDLVARLRAQGYRAELRWSAGGLRACRRAGVFVYSGYRSDINRWLAPGALAVCLWHGLPIKKIERDVTPSVAQRGVRGALHRLAEEPPPDALLSSTAFVTSLMAPAFGVSPERCWELGYPRNDHLVRSPGSPPPPALVPDARLWHELERRRPVVGLFLTWRDQSATDVADAALVQRLSETCGRHGVVLAYKAHFNVAGAQVGSPSCVTLPGDADLNAYLGLCDVLITDYSSVALDFLLLDRPTLYFMPDLEEYARTRGFYVDPSALPGTITRCPDELVGALDDLLRAGPARAGDETGRDRTRRSFWGSYDGAAAARITAALEARLR